MAGTPRDALGARLAGAVLEIGPGHEPFPVAPGAVVTYADKSVPGGRDDVWPELIGSPRGPDADVDIDLDVDGLQPFDDVTFDAVVASHVLEHLADPIAALLEVDRVLRPGGRVAIVMPDRLRTFDRVRIPTTLEHVLLEHERGVREVDDEHIREFCSAIWGQTPIHPEPVRSWHDPAALDAERLALHRRRSIHVHCWSADEFVVLVAALVARGALGWELVDQFIAEDTDPPGIEFGLLCAKGPTRGDEERREAASRLLEGWATQVAGGRPERRPLLAALAATAARDLGTGPHAVTRAAAVPTSVLAADASHWERRAGELERELEAIRTSRTWRAGRLLTGPLARLRRR